MSELSSSDKARLKESYPGLYIVALTFDDVKTLKMMRETLACVWEDAPDDEAAAAVKAEQDLVKQMIADAES